MNNKNSDLHEDLDRGLEERHIQLIALGGAIGVGLFLGSASTISMAGPSILLDYAIGGTILFFIMRALGEMSVEQPLAGSFSAYANEYIGPLAGYLTGWTYWLNWISCCMAEITAIGIYINFWFPSVPRWVSAFAALALMITVNLINVKAYGEFEFWFAIIKVVAIIVMIILGLIVIFTGIGNGGKIVGFTNLWKNGGFFPNGIKGLLKALPLVTFAFFATELIGITAGEAKNPEKTIPSAINKVFWRICIFYIGSLTVIMSLYPWNKIGVIGSPFVLTFNKIGIKAAAGIINFVVLTAALSSCNSGIYTTGRMVYNLSLQGGAPKIFSKLSSTKVPKNAIIGSSSCMLVGVILNYFLPARVFTYIASIATFAGLFAWFMIVLGQMKFRKTLTQKQIGELKFPTKGYPYVSYISLAYLVFVFVMMAFNPDTVIAVVLGPIWIAALIICYYVFGVNKNATKKKKSVVQENHN